jgi:hypothetical protein
MQFRNKLGNWLVYGGCLLVLAAVGWANRPKTWTVEAYQAPTPTVVRQFATNFAADLYGPIDTRPATWGHADYHVWTIEMKNVPPLHRVRVLRVFGDVVSYVRNPSDKTAGTLFGLGTTAPDGNIGLDGVQRCDFCALNTMLYVQDFVGPTGGGGQRGFDYNVADAGLLERDHKLLVKVAAWLNETNQPVHIEPTFNVVYRYEREQ